MLLEAEDQKRHRARLNDCRGEWRLVARNRAQAPDRRLLGLRVRVLEPLAHCDERVMFHGEVRDLSGAAHGCMQQEHGRVHER